MADKVKPKLLVLDIETRPAKSYHWRMFKENISTDQNIDSGGILCVGMKWVGLKEVYMYSEWEHGMETMLNAVKLAINEADAIITKNGKRFDIPWLNVEFIKNGIMPPAPTTHIDLDDTLKKNFKFLSRKLDFVGKELKVGRKVKHEGFELWLKVMDGNEAARKRMLRYCGGDVRLTERVFKKIRPFITNFPHLGFASPRECPHCGSEHVHVSKYRRTKTMRIQQLHCQSCGQYYDGQRKRLV
jgi:DNA polymerase elongation subunit (family B)